MLRPLTNKIGAVLRRRRLDEELDEEIGTHLEMAEEQYLASGMSPEAARRAARRDFGGVGRAKERHREVRGLPWLEDVARDTRLAVRKIRRAPGFAVVTVLSLALGVGANAAIFNAANALFLRPVPGVSEPERVVELLQTDSRGGGFSSMAYPDFLDLKGQVMTFESIAALSIEVFSVSLGAVGERVAGMHVTPEYFDVMGVLPERGRFFLASEDRAGGGVAVAVLSHRLWEERFGADPAILGTTIRVNRVPFEVVGIAPPEFRGHTVAVEPAVYLPMQASIAVGTVDPELFQNRRGSWLSAVARLAPGATATEAEAQVRAVYARLAETYPATNGTRSGQSVALGLIPAEARSAVGAFLLVLGAMVLLILLVTGANVAGMFVARNSAREKEIGVRLSLGAGRGRLVQQLVIEALVLFAIAGTLGTGVGIWLVGLAPIDTIPVAVPIHLDLSPDAGVLLFGLAMTVGTGLVFGLLPALQATRPGFTLSLKQDGGRRSSGGRMRRFFVAGQVALSLVLLVSAGLLLRALERASELDAGFDAAGRYKTGVNLELEGYGEAEGILFQDILVQRLANLPGVQSVALADDLPLDLSAQGTIAVPEDWTGDDGQTRLRVDYNQVSPRYFETLGVDLLRGRSFESRDRPGSEPVAIVSRSFADRVWPGESALGRRVQAFQGLAAGYTEFRTIVGVVDDVKSQLITDLPSPALYLPLAQAYSPSTNIVVRAEPDLGGVAAMVREAILSTDPSISMEPVVSLEDYTRVGILPQQLAAGFAVGLGLVALLLAAIGVYGVVAFAVAQRTREIGLRLALGAAAPSVLRLVMRDGLRLAVPGLVLGLLGAVGTGYLLRFLLLGLNPTDPVTLGVVAAVLVLAVVVASLVPARRAMAIEPMRALRVD